MRTALITGGAQGIGAAVARKFLGEGFSGVRWVDRNAEKLAAMQKQIGKGAEIYAGDLRGRGHRRRRSQGGQSFGRLDVLVNAAGIRRAAALRIQAGSFDRLFEVNVKAPLFMMQKQPKHGGGQVRRDHQYCQHAGLWGPPNLTTYSASKSALMTLSRSAANTFKRDGIRVFCVNLGWTLTMANMSCKRPFTSCQKTGPKKTVPHAVWPVDHG